MAAPGAARVARWGQLARERVVYTAARSSAAKTTSPDTQAASRLLIHGHPFFL